MFLPGARSAVDFGGRVACLPWNADPVGLILALETGDTLGRFSPATSMLPLRPVQRDSEVTRLTDFARRIEVSFDPDRVPRAQPSLAGVFFDDRGRIWLVRLTPDGRTAFDRVGPGGTIDAVLDSPVDAFSVVRFFGDRAYFVTTRYDVPVIVRARIEPAPAGQ
ncbi:MAG: hypothetical protein AB7L66_07710 [Gemmatimonadales bacterium]